MLIRDLICTLSYTLTRDNKVLEKIQADSFFSCFFSCPHFFMLLFEHRAIFLLNLDNIPLPVDNIQVWFKLKEIADN